MTGKISKIKTMEHLEAGDCRWPIGDPRQAGFHFCGASQTAGRPYCIEHWALSFVPSRSRHHGPAPALPIRQAA